MAVEPNVIRDEEVAGPSGRSARTDHGRGA